MTRSEHATPPEWIWPPPLRYFGPPLEQRPTSPEIGPFDWMSTNR